MHFQLIFNHLSFLHSFLLFSNCKFLDGLSYASNPLAQLADSNAAVQHEIEPFVLLPPHLDRVANPGVNAHSEIVAESSCELLLTSVHLSLISDLEDASIWVSLHLNLPDVVVGLLGLHPLNQSLPQLGGVVFVKGDGRPSPFKASRKVVSCPYRYDSKGDLLCADSALCNELHHPEHCPIPSTHNHLDLPLLALILLFGYSCNLFQILVLFAAVKEIHQVEDHLSAPIVVVVKPVIGDCEVLLAETTPAFGVDEEEEVYSWLWRLSDLGTV